MPVILDQDGGRRSPGDRSVIAAVAFRRSIGPARQALVNFLHGELLAHTEVDEGFALTADEIDLGGLVDDFPEIVGSARGD